MDMAAALPKLELPTTSAGAASPEVEPAIDKEFAAAMVSLLLLECGGMCSRGRRRGAMVEARVGGATALCSRGAAERDLR